MSRSLEFTKMHGAGNDFVVLDATTQDLPPLEAFSRRISDRHFGIGADQVLVVERPTGGEGGDADFRMDIYNADGSRVEMCANGIRAFYEYLRGHGLTTADEVRVETLAPLVAAFLAGAERPTPISTWRRFAERRGLARDDVEAVAREYVAERVLLLG